MDQESSQRDLLARLAVVGARAGGLVEHRRRSDADPEDRFRGLYVSDDDVDELLRADRPRIDVAPPDPSLERAAELVDAEAAAAAAAGRPSRVTSLQQAFALSPLDIDLLMVAIAPDLDPRFEKVFGYLNDDVTRKRASIGLALGLCGRDPVDGNARARLGSAGPLVTGRLVEVEDPERPFLSRALRVPDRVVSHLLADETRDPAVAAYLVDAVDADVGWDQGVARALRSDSRLIYLREVTGSAAGAHLAHALRATGHGVLAVDLTRLDPSDDPADVAALVCREARLGGAALLVLHIEALAERGPGAVRSFADLPVVVALTGARGWDPRWSTAAPLVLDAPVQAEEHRRDAWIDALADPEVVSGEAWRSVTAYRLAPEQVRRAADAALQLASAAGRPLGLADLQAGARAQNAAGLEHLARRVAPKAGWADLVLPAEVAGQLRELVGRVRQRPRVLDEWGMGDSSSRGRGITVLFSGDSGTGKTLSAEVVSRDLGLDLYVIDLSTVVDKYIGETEKNLDRIFGEAERVNGVLLFDEADAIFGKRSEVRDARDRYANVEVAYLLQRMEQFEGVAILTTNLRANVDEAFLRRLDLLVEFPMPDEESRRRLWAGQLSPGVPRADDIDVDFLARSFELSGGNIRSIVVTAAYAAADGDRPVAMEDLVRATASEYRKLGRLCVEAEFGAYHPLVSAGARP